MSESGNLTIIIQAGGESRRMGRSKATVPFLGEPLLLRGVRCLLPLADEFIITTNEPQNLTFLSEWTENGRIRLVTDICDIRGALRGINTAFSAATTEYVAMIACDMIFPSCRLIEAELKALIETGCDAAVPHTLYGYEPFHGVYRRKTCLAAVEAALADGEERAASWFNRISVREFTPEMIDEIEPRGCCFVNANTPDELAAAEQQVMACLVQEGERVGA